MIDDIILNRGDNGLGFNIRGGIDAPHLAEDSGIFVTKIRESGAAIEEGSLQPGDKLLQLNGQSLEELKHSEVVDLFKNVTGSVIRLRVERQVETRIMHERSLAAAAAMAAAKMMANGISVSDLDEYNNDGGTSCALQFQALVDGINCSSFTAPPNELLFHNSTVPEDSVNEFDVLQTMSAHSKCSDERAEAHSSSSSVRASLLGGSLVLAAVTMLLCYAFVRRQVR